MRLGPAARHHDGDVGQPKALRRQHATVAGDDGAGLVGQDRVGEAERLDARRDLGDLLVAVCAGVPDVGRQARDVPPLDTVGGPGRGGDLNAVGSGNCHGASIADWQKSADGDV